jgi:replicative DNA helicase
MKRDEVSTLREPPWSQSTEQSLLGALMLDGGAFDKAADILTEADFYAHEHRTVWRAIATLDARLKPIDIVTVYEACQQANAGIELAYLNAMAQSVPSSALVRRYAEIVAERSQHRALIAAADSASSLAWAEDRTHAERLDSIASLFDALSKRGQKSAPKAVGELLAGALDRYTELSEGGRKAGLQTGFSRLDWTLQGLKPGRVYGIAARPSVGKSSTARSIALSVARKGSPVLVLSQEMPQDEQTDCVIAELGQIDNERLQMGNLSQDDWSRLAEAADEAKDLPLYFDEQGSLTLFDIRAKARSVKKLGLLVIDYLQLCSSTLKGKTTNDEIAELTKGIKALALEMRIPVVLLSQLNREVEKRADKEPQLSDLRDSGAIEQDLDAAILLWTVSENESTRIVGFKVAKHRGGKKGRFAMKFEPAIYRWTDAEFPVEPKTSRGAL